MLFRMDREEMHERDEAMRKRNKKISDSNTQMQAANTEMDKANRKVVSRLKKQRKDVNQAAFRIVRES
jgi:hypothetical protein